MAATIKLSVVCQRS